MKKIIELPEELNDYILLKAKELAYTMCIFFEYILTPRDHYVEITLSEIKPNITEQMLSYCIQNILGIVVDYTNTNKGNKQIFEYCPTLIQSFFTPWYEWSASIKTNQSFFSISSLRIAFATTCP